MKPFLAPVLSCLLLNACATSTESGRVRMIAPTEVGVAYSEVEAQARLALTPDVNCQETDCASIDAFRVQVLQIGERLDKAAYKLALELNLPPPHFNVTVPGKHDIGTLSTASGSIIVFDGLHEFEFQEPALAFLIAREMGHVLSRHHEENSATNLSISLVVGLFFPVAHLIRGAEAAYAAASTTSLASSAASFAGSRIVKGLYRSDQQREADAMALRILAYADWTPFDVANALQMALPRLSGEGWVSELIESKLWLDQITIGPQLKPALANELSGDSAPALPVAETPVVETPAVALMPEASTGSAPVQASVAVEPLLTSPKAAPVVKKADVKKTVRNCTVRTDRIGKKIVRCSPPVANKPKPRSGSTPKTGSRPRAAQ